MSDFNVRADAVDVDDIMRQIRARIREKRGADYTEAEVAKLASVKLEKFIDPKGVRSDLVEQFRKSMAGAETADAAIDEAPLYDSPRPWLRSLRRLLNPILRLFINPSGLVRAAQVSAVERRRQDMLIYELVHNLVVEVTRLGIDVHNLKMRVESLSSRVEFDERRGRALEGVVQYRPPAPRPEPRREPQRPSPRPEPRPQPRSEPRPADVKPEPGPDAASIESAASPTPDTVASASAAPTANVPAQDGDRRRRRRRRRRRPGQTMAGAQTNGPAAAPGTGAAASTGAPPAEVQGAPDFDDDGPDDGAPEE